MTVARVNLLPHRAERRKRAKQQFFLVSGGTAVIGLLIVILVHSYYAEQISTQEGRNQFLKGEISKLDKEIAEINKLKDEIQALLARKQIIETLQADRAQTVHLLDELVKQMPEGVFLKSIAQKGMRVQLLGYAQSNARVSTLMRNIESSRWLGNPELIEVKSAGLDKRRVSEFTMFVSLKRPQAETPPTPAKPAAGAAAGAPPGAPAPAGAPASAPAAAKKG
jgi:type IV pilus assembly protein PilN